MTLLFCDLGGRSQEERGEGRGEAGDVDVHHPRDPQQEETAFRGSGFRFRVSGFGFRVSGFRVSSLGFRVSGFKFWVQ
jgi:hypothetical protein